MRHKLHHRPKILSRSRTAGLSSDEQSFSVVSYNVLCDRFATPRRYPHVHPQFLQWEWRWPRLRHELAAFGADIVCLQEVTLERWAGGAGGGRPRSAGWRAGQPARQLIISAAAGLSWEDSTVGRQPAGGLLQQARNHPPACPASAACTDRVSAPTRTARRFNELKQHMASLGYAAVLQVGCAVAFGLGPEDGAQRTGGHQQCWQPERPALQQQPTGLH